MSPTVRQMRALVAVARTGSFTAAAELLHVTQSALSGQIKELEQLLGVRLFYKITAGTRLTPAGEALLRRVKLVFAVEGERAAAEPGLGFESGVVARGVEEPLERVFGPGGAGADGGDAGGFGAHASQ